MSSERDTDRMAGELLNLLKGSLTKPVAGTGVPRPQAQPEESSMLNTIKDFLNQSLPGTKPIAKPTASTPVGAGASQSSAGSEVVVGGWEGLFRRQGQERELMHQRHERERTEMHQRHGQEMESALGGQSGAIPVPYGHTVRRSARPMGPTRMPPDR